VQSQETDKPDTPSSSSSNSKSSNESKESTPQPFEETKKEKGTPEPEKKVTVEKNCFYIEVSISFYFFLGPKARKRTCSSSATAASQRCHNTD
jgi:hypothetical protein